MITPQYDATQNVVYHVALNGLLSKIYVFCNIFIQEYHVFLCTYGELVLGSPGPLYT